MALWGVVLGTRLCLPRCHSDGVSVPEGWPQPRCWEWMHRGQASSGTMDQGQGPSALCDRTGLEWGKSGPAPSCFGYTGAKVW